MTKQVFYPCSQVKPEQAPSGTTTTALSTMPPLQTGTTLLSIHPTSTTMPLLHPRNPYMLHGRPGQHYLTAVAHRRRPVARRLGSAEHSTTTSAACEGTILLDKVARISMKPHCNKTQPGWRAGSRPLPAKCGSKCAVWCAPTRTNSSKQLAALRICQQLKSASS